MTTKEKVTETAPAVAPAEAGAQRGLSKTREGYVVSAKMAKTVVVAVTGRKRHATFGKFVRFSRHYMAHDERGECQLGDRVLIVESRPISKRKRWRVRSILERAV